MDENLVVVRGGSTPDRDGFDDPWPPLDSFQAPYRQAVRREVIKIVLQIHCKKRSATVVPAHREFDKWHSGCTANEGRVKIEYKCLFPINVFPEMKLCSLVISKIELSVSPSYTPIPVRD